MIQRNKELLETFAKIAETRYSVGEGIQQDVIKAHVEVSKMVDELLMQAQRKKSPGGQAEYPSQSTTGDPVGKPEEVVFRKFPLTIEELQKMALEMNPTLKGMKKMIEMKEKAYALPRRSIILTLISGLPMARGITGRKG